MKPRVNCDEIRFFVDPRSTEQDIKAILDQVANMIFGLSGPGVAIKKCSGYRYGLGFRQGKLQCFTNDWWADVGANGDAPNEIVVAYRYGLSQEMSEKLSKLRDTIIWLLDLERFNLPEKDELTMYEHRCPKGHLFYSALQQDDNCPWCAPALE
jgi:hypothetical protein